MFRRVLVAAVLSVGMGVSGTAMAAQAASTTPAVSGVSAVSAATGVAAPATQAAPTFFCAPVIAQICTLLAPVICRTHCEAAVSAPAVAAPSSASTGRMSAAATPSLRTAAPTFFCAPVISEICTLLAPIICRTHCEAAVSGSSAAALPPFYDLCTVNIRPINPFCLLP